MSTLNVQIPKALDFLFTPARYKIAYGGRDSTKTWGYARALLVKSIESPLRILGARELQVSIKESVHKVISDQVRILDMGAFFKVENTAIKGVNGSDFFFEGLRHNIDKIKSYEGIDIVWVEEANNVSANSWQVLIPTIRKPGSEIWVTFNPMLETDETYRRFVKDPPANAIVRKLTYRDNLWLSDESKQEMAELKRRDEDAFLNIYEGHCRVTLDGAIYAVELREATRDGRILRVGYDQRVPVHTFWDLGWSDCTSIWFVQKVGFDYHVIDFYQNRLQKLPHYLEVLQNKHYVYGTHYLPHDADHESLAAPSIAKQMRTNGSKVTTVERIKNKQLGINATRAIFDRLYFDEVKTADGLQALRHYAYEVDEYGQWSKEPMHDENSHAADALRTMGESIGMPDRRPVQDVIQLIQISKGEESAAWMG